MYTYSGLGLNGRLGNQMFQYATLLSLAKHYDTEFAIPDSIERSDFPLKGRYELLQAFPQLTAKVISSSGMESIDRQYREPSFAFDPNIFLTRDDTDIHGFFQSESYFGHNKDIIKKEFDFASDVRSASALKIDKVRCLIPDMNLCAVHVRRGDYSEKPEYHTNLDGTYYNIAINNIITSFDNTHIMVFSDDIEWCKKNMPSEFSFSNAKNQYEDMCMMSMCDTHVIANSSFSWWAAWLSNSSRIIAPKDWFGLTGPKDYSSIYCSHWLIA